MQSILEAAREQSTATVFFHNAIAEHFGLGGTDTKTLDILARMGPLSAGEIGQHTGLTSASVTSLIDRLEEKGYVRRRRDPEDRRRVIVELDHEGTREIARMFETLPKSDDTFFDSFSEAELEVIYRYLVRSTKWLRAVTEALQREHTGDDSS